MAITERLLDAALAVSRTIVIVGTEKNAGKTTTFNALRTAVEERGLALAIASIGRDGEPLDALDDRVKPRISVAPGTLVSTARGLLPRSPAMHVVDVGARSALGPIIIARAMRETTLEVAGAPTALAMRATIDRLRELAGSAAVVLVDGAIDRIAALSLGAGDSTIVATGGAQASGIDAVARRAREFCARLALPAFDGGEHDAVEVLDERAAAALLAQPRRLPVVVRDPTRVTLGPTVLARVRAQVDVRVRHAFRVIACTTAAPFVEAVARATGLPTFDVVGGRQA